MATCLCPPPPLALVAPPLPLSPRHPRLPTGLPAGPKSCRPSTVHAVEHAPMHAKKACCGLAPVPRANTLNVRLLLSADEMSCFLAPSFLMAPATGNANKANKAARNGAIGKAVRRMPLRVRRYDVAEAGRETLDKSPCPSFTYCQASTLGIRLYQECTSWAGWSVWSGASIKVNVVPLPAEKSCFGPSYTNQARLFPSSRQTKH